MEFFLNIRQTFFQYPTNNFWKRGEYFSYLRWTSFLNTRQIFLKYAVIFSKYIVNNFQMPNELFFDTWWTFFKAATATSSRYSASKRCRHRHCLAAAFGHSPSRSCVASSSPRTSRHRKRSEDLKSVMRPGAWRSFGSSHKTCRCSNGCSTARSVHGASSPSKF